MSARPLYRWHEPAFRTQYAELKERTAAAGQLLPGTTGTLTKRSPNPGGREYWYRVYSTLPGRQSERFVGSVHEGGAYAPIGGPRALAVWLQAQVIPFPNLGTQVAARRMPAV